MLKYVSMEYGMEKYKDFRSEMQEWKDFYCHMIKERKKGKVFEYIKMLKLMYSLGRPLTKEEIEKYRIK